jgi:hypothetical protein
MLQPIRPIADQRHDATGSRALTAFLILQIAFMLVFARFAIDPSGLIGIDADGIIVAWIASSVGLGLFAVAVHEAPDDTEATFQDLSLGLQRSGPGLGKASMPRLDEFLRPIIAKLGGEHEDRLVQHLAHVRGGAAAAVVRWLDWRRHKRPLGICRIRRIAKAVPIGRRPMLRRSRHPANGTRR